MQASEAEMVGRAAAQFTAQWDLPPRLAPTSDEATTFWFARDLQRQDARSATAGYSLRLATRHER
jgi:hypothetical protein